MSQKGIFNTSYLTARPLHRTWVCSAPHEGKGHLRAQHWAVDPQSLPTAGTASPKIKKKTNLENQDISGNNPTTQKVKEISANSPVKNMSGEKHLCLFA